MSFVVRPASVPTETWKGPWDEYSHTVIYCHTFFETSLFQIPWLKESQQIMMLPYL